MPTILETRNIEALEAIAEAAQYQLHIARGDKPLVPTHMDRRSKELVFAERPDKAGEWIVTTENSVTTQRRSVHMVPGEFDKAYQSLATIKESSQEPTPYRNKATQEVVMAVFATDGDPTDVIVTHADGRADERIKHDAFKAAFDPLEPAAVKPAA
jgi:hypothetical protein